MKTGADFPKYVKEISALGLKNYAYIVADGSTVYNGANGYQILSPYRYAVMDINISANAEVLYNCIFIHQQGANRVYNLLQTSGCSRSKQVGDANAMVCTYYEANGKAILAEPIQQSEY